MARAEAEELARLEKARSLLRKPLAHAFVTCAGEGVRCRDCAHGRRARRSGHGATTFCCPVSLLFVARSRLSRARRRWRMIPTTTLLAQAKTPRSRHTRCLYSRYSCCRRVFRAYGLRSRSVWRLKFANRRCENLARTDPKRQMRACARARSLMRNHVHRSARSARMRDGSTVTRVRTHLARTAVTIH